MPRLVFQVVARVLIVLVPVGILDDHLQPRVDFLARADQVSRYFRHQVQPEPSPALVSLGRDVGVGLAAGEEEIVDDDFIEVARGIFDNLPELLAVFGIGVDEGLEAVSLVDHRGDAAGRLDALALEETLGCVERCLVGYDSVAMGFEVDLVHLQPAGDGGPSRFQPRRVLHLHHFVSAGVGSHAEIVVIAGFGDGSQGQRADDRER